MILHDPNEMYRFPLVDGMNDCADYIPKVAEAINDLLRADEDIRVVRHRVNDGPDWPEVEGIPAIVFLRQYADALIVPELGGKIALAIGGDLEWTAELIRHQRYAVGGIGYRLLTYEVEEAS